MVYQREFADAAEDLLNAKTRRELCARARSIPEIRKEIVTALQKAVRSGTYRVRDEDIAAAICRELKFGR